MTKVKKVFEAANGYRMPIVVHLRTSIDRSRKYGADQTRVFLNELLAVASDVPVQIAHLAGAGGFDSTIDSALSVFTDAIAKHDARMKNVWFDATVVVRPSMSPDDLQRTHSANWRRARAVRLGRARESSRVSEGRLGGVPTTSAGARGATRRRDQHPAVHA